MLHPLFVIVGTGIAISGSVLYLVRTIQGKVKPNKVTFLIWTIIPFIVLTVQLKKGVGLQTITTFSMGFLPLLIFIASFFNHKSQWKLTRFDFICGALSLAGICLWIAAGDGTIAIILSIIANTMAGVPTIIKAYKKPQTEVSWPWLATAVGMTLTLFTLETWTLDNAGFIFSILLTSGIIFLLVQRKKSMF